MKLSALAQASGVSTASIKFYIHTGILPPGKKKNATTAIYGDQHVHRLALISWLRRELNISLDAIGSLVRAIEDPDLDSVDLMAKCQELALSAGSFFPFATTDPKGVTSADPEADSTAHPETDATVERDATSPRRRFADDVQAALAELGWMDASPMASAAVAQILEVLDKAGYTVGKDTVIRHAKALTEIANRNTRPINDELSRDEISLQVIRGITVHNRLLLATSALVHASLTAAARKSPE